MPRLSVLMPARDAAQTIGAAVRSTLRALPRDGELVMLDDGSTDDTAARAEAAGDARLRVLRSPEAGGVAGALRTLLAATDSELVARMDADDVTLPTRFAAQRRALDRGADLVFTTFQVIDARGLPRLPALPVGFSPRVGALALLLDCPYPHSTLLARRASLDAAGGYRDAVTEDYDLWLRAAAQGARIARLGRPGILLRAHGASVSAQAGFRERLAADPLLAESYLALARTLLGVDHATWLTRLAFLRRGPLGDADRAIVAPFVDRFLGALDEARPGAVERWALRRRARQELTSRA